jgi:1,5-anhydro-D-fructose reductase (1,5-anhydro-D-mannitol-forming)
MLKLALLGFWHVHAKDYFKDAKNHPDTEVVVAWDEDKSLGQGEATKYGLPFAEGLETVLASDINGVIVTTPTSLHHQVLTAAAKAGKHIFTEKVVAATLKEANDIVKAVNVASVKLVVSLPRLNSGSTVAIQKIIQAGTLGQLTQVRVRLSHDGGLPNEQSASNQKIKTGWLPEHFYNLSESAGGAMIDLGCHPMYLTRLFLGMPEAISANYGYITKREVEDNAVVTLHYPNGAIGVVEAGFVNPRSPFSIEVHGTEGSLLYGTPDAKLLVRTTKQDTWQEITASANQPSAFEQWVSHIQNNTVATENISLATDLSALMEAANLSAKTKQAVALQSLAV